MRQIAVRIVDGLLDPNPDDLENFVQGAIASNFGSYLPQTQFSHDYDDGMASNRDTWRTALDSDDGLVKLTLAVSTVPEDEGQGFQIWFYMTTKLTRWDAHFVSWDMRLRRITPEEIPAVAQQYFLWLTGAVPTIINSPKDNIEAYKHIPTRLKYQLQRALWQWEEGNR